MASAARGDMLKNLLSNAAGFERKFPNLEMIEASWNAGMDAVSKRISGIYKGRRIKLRGDLQFGIQFVPGIMYYLHDGEVPKVDRRLARQAC